MWLKAFQCVRGGCRQTKLCLQASSQKEKKHCSTMWLTRTGSDDDIGLVCLFTKHSLIILQAVLPRRADPTELKAIFEKVGFDLYVLFSFLSLPSFKEGFLPSFDLGFFSFFKWISKAQPCVFIFYKKNVLFYSMPASRRMRNTSCRRRTLWAVSSMLTRTFCWPMRPQICWLEWWTRRKMGQCTIYLLGNENFTYVGFCRQF